MDGTSHNEKRIGQKKIEGLYSKRQFVIRLGGFREFLSREFRHTRTQVRSSGSTAVTVRHQSEGVAMARKPVRPVVHRRLRERLRGTNDILATGRQHYIRHVQHVGHPFVLFASALGYYGRVLCL